MPTPSETLCLSCGMCCDGSLHNFTFLRSDEVPQARRQGLRVRQRRDGIPLFLQPCSGFHAMQCVIYTQRPQSCRQYQCKLLLSLEAGETDLPTAVEAAQRTREMIDALRCLMPDADPRLSLDQQVKSSWDARKPLPENVRTVFDELAERLHIHYGVRWRRGPSRFRRWMKKLREKGF